MPKDNGQLSSNADDKWKPVQLKDHCRTLDSVTVLYNSSMIRQPTSWMMTYCSTSFGNEQNLTLCFPSLDPEPGTCMWIASPMPPVESGHHCLKINWNKFLPRHGQFPSTVRIVSCLFPMSLRDKDSDSGARAAHQLLRATRML